MTFKECLIKTRKLINYYSIAGSVVLDSDETQRDYTARAIAAIDTAQKELAAVCPLIRHVQYVQRPLRPLAVRSKTFTLDGDFSLEAVGAGAFSFTADGDVQAVAEVFTNNRWQERLAVADVSEGEVKLISGELENITENTRVRLTVSGDGVEISGLALYADFPKHEELPIFGEPRRRVLPSDFSRVAMVSALPFRDRVRKTAFYAVDDGKIGFPWEFCGKIDMAYEVFPRTVTENTEDDFVLDLPDNAAEAIPCFAASMILTDDDPKMAQFFLKMYTERRDRLMRPESQSVVNTLWR